MRKIVPFFMLVVVGFLLQWDGIKAFVEVLEKPLISIQQYRSYTDDFKAITLFMALSLLFLTFYLSGSEPAGENKVLAKQWLVPFLVLVGLSAVLVTSTNPDGRFPWNKRNAYISAAARAIKPGLYRELPNMPDIVFFGSSVSFTIPAEYSRENWNVDAFNMALNGGAHNDFFQMLKFMIEVSPEKQAPRVVTIEVLNRGLDVTTGSLTPLELIPYMDWDQRLVTAFSAADDTIKLSHVSDSVFTRLFVDDGQWQTAVNFSADGSGVRSSKNISVTNYQQSMGRNFGLVNGLLSCDSLDPDGVKYIEKLVALSREYNFGIVFYTAPINSDFYTFNNVKARRYAYCQKLLNEYMQGLVSQNPNVYFRDLSSYEPISTHGQETYIDTHHLTEKGSMLLLDELRGDIESAMQWAQENRQP